jgi:hypothetical protein
MEGRARSGLFIPSTLHGSYMDTSTGMIDNEMLTKNLNCAIDLYNNAPCAKTTIQFFKGPDSSMKQRIRQVFKK